MDKEKKVKTDAINRIKNTEQEPAFGNCIDVHADELFKKVKRNPLLSMAIASSIGYFLAKIIR
jgi:hypothetical protein